MDTLSTLLSISATDPKNRQIIIDRLTHNDVARDVSLRTALNLAEIECQRSSAPLLAPQSKTAGLLALLFERREMGLAIASYLGDPSVVKGSVGIRYALYNWAWAFQGAPDLGKLLVDYFDRLLVEFYQSSSPPVRPFRLLELVLQKRLVHPPMLSPGTLLAISTNLRSSDPHESLHILRISVAGTLLDEDLTSRVVSVVTETGSRSPAVRCLAFSVLSVHYHPSGQNIQDAEVARLAVEVLLCKTEWQLTNTTSILVCTLLLSPKPPPH